MSDVRKSSKHSANPTTRSALHPKTGHTKRGLHPVAKEPGMGSLTIVAPAADADSPDQLRVEYASEGAEVAALPPDVAPERATELVAAAIAGSEAGVAPAVQAPVAEARRSTDEASKGDGVSRSAVPPPVMPRMAPPPAPPHAGAPGNASGNAQQMTASPSHAVPPQASYVPMQPLLFEIAWEVCWQLGGIYTVIRSKAPQMTRIWGERYCLIGPYNADTAAVELEESQPTGPIAIAIERLRAMGIRVHYGNWLITGRPRVILLEFGAALERLGEFKYYLWKDHGIQTNEGDGEVNNVVSFGFLIGLFFQELCKIPNLSLPILAHFHEWMSGLGLMRIKHLNLPVATVFTTHATLLGRYLCTDNPDFYNKLPWINPDHAAGHYNIYARYCIERGATHSADAFTTVSDVTGLEAEKLLSRRPDVVTPNGLNIRKFAALHEFQNLHKQFKEVIHQFVAGHFFPSYHFDLDKTMYLFISGRYEYRNKGMDLFIEALARLNHWLRAGGIPVNVVAFIVTRAPYKNINVDVLRAQSMFDELAKMCENITEEMGRSLLHTVSMGRLPDRGELMTEEAVVRLKRGMHAWRTWKQPPIVTHDLWDDATDPVLTQLRSCQLFNARHDAVKVVFHPDFLSATSPLLGLDYDQFIRGCHMGVFPSYYEPWGYTPAECVASGVPAVTSDLAGFGSYVQQNIQDPNSKGLFIVGRRYASWEQSAHQLTEILFNFCLKDRRSRIELRNRTERLSDSFDWGTLITHYNEAHKMAMQRKAGVTIQRMPREFKKTLALINEGVDAGLHIGAQLFVTRDSVRVADFALGLARLAADSPDRCDVPMATDTLMLWLSAGKPITAAAIAMLWEHGKLALDKPVATYLPEFARHGKEAITIRHVLTHTSGIRGVDTSYPFATWEETLARIYDMKIERDWIPGMRAGYHTHTSWYVLGEIISRLTGMSHDRWIRENLLLPLGMNDTWLAMPGETYRAYDSRVGYLYNTTEKPPRPLLNYDTELAASRPRPSASCRGPMCDLARFYQMLRLGGTLDGVRVLKPETVAAMTLRQRVGMFDLTFRHTIDWGLGLILNSAHYGAGIPYQFGPRASREAFGHGGSQSSTGFCDPRHKLAVALLFNGCPGEQAHDRRLRAVLQALYEDLEI